MCIRDRAYSFTLSPTIADLAGNRLDQNAHGTGGEAGDAYTLSTTLALPNRPSGRFSAMRAPSVRSSHAVREAVGPVSYTHLDVYKRQEDQHQ